MRLLCLVRSSQPYIILSFLSTRQSRKSARSLLLSSAYSSHSIAGTGACRVTRQRMAPELIDIDCNLLHTDLKTLKKVDTMAPWNILEEDAVRGANIVAMISPSSTIAESESGLELLRANPPPLTVKTTVGVHPYHVNDESILFSNNGKKITLEEQKLKIKNLLMANGGKTTSDLCVAVGECGLDATEGFPPLEDQIPWFRLQIEIAQELSLPLFVHERLAFEATIDMLKQVDPSRVPIIIHCFTGTKVECMAYIERGYFISVSGYILKKELNGNCKEVISCLEEGLIPLDKLMIETDAPYMGFEGCRQLYLESNQIYLKSLNSKNQKRLKKSIYPNVPSSLPMVLSKVTECLQVNDPSLTKDKVAKLMTTNARKFFRL